MKSLKEFLVGEKFITPEEWEKAEKEAKNQRRVDEVLLEKGVVDEYTLLQAFSALLDIPYKEEIKREEISSEILKTIPLPILKEKKVIPLHCTKDTLELATYDPISLDNLEELSLLSGKALRIVISPREQVEKGWEELRHPLARADEVFEITEEGKKEDEKKEDDLLDLAHKPPIIKFVNLVLYEALKMRATDIHIEPLEKGGRIRYRVDGILHEISTPPPHYLPAIISRIKVMSNLNIAERRLPQDGRFWIKQEGEEIDVRVSIIPTLWGERVVLRLLHRAQLLSLEELGLEKDNFQRLKELITLPNGIILVTGPTGSGKTTTLYSALTRINSPDKNIITIEDPVEYQLNGVAQIQVKPSIDLTFANGLRSILRHDPDIILIGEMRDQMTAEIAIRASLTGHLVFSTLHTNDSASAITRLIDIGIEPFLVSSSVRAIIAQRLVRKICPHCKVETSVDTAEWKSLTTLPPPSNTWKGKGCKKCLGTGYLGRTGIYEILTIDNRIRKMITERVESHIIKEEAKRRGMKNLLEDGLIKVKKGITTLEEVLRVTQEA
ncbi:MAG: type II/IV secretion system protein [Caldiserica bacterium]|nr:type II/IV secretion system protein [Caldisericota bacterium]